MSGVALNQHASKLFQVSVQASIPESDEVSNPRRFPRSDSGSDAKVLCAGGSPRRDPDVEQIGPVALDAGVGGNPFRWLLEEPRVDTRERWWQGSVQVQITPPI
jgi:hypothetical protein